MALPDRFWEKVYADPNSGCWLWAAAIDKCGYGIFAVDRKPTRAHRFSFEVLVGEIPKGLELDHLCRVRNCVNPEHLEPVTHAENMRRGKGGQNMAKKTHCPQGHPYKGDNLIIGSDGRRRCRTCRKKQDVNRYWRWNGGQ